MNKQILVYKNKLCNIVRNNMDESQKHIKDNKTRYNSL